MPQNTVAIWNCLRRLNVPQTPGCVFGATEIAIATCLFLGGFRTVAYGAGLAVGVVSVVVSWRRFLDPRGDPANRLLIAGAPVPDLLIALFLLWHWDRGA